MKVRTIADGVAQGDDNFLLLRLIAAAMVIYGHAPGISATTGPADLFMALNWGEYSGAIAVDLFFIVSGFMITGSYLRREHLGSYLWARLLRIVPAYAVCMGVCAFVIGPIFSVQPAVDYFSNP